MIRHTIEPKPKRDMLRVVVEFDLRELLGMIGHEGFESYVHKYLGEVAEDVLDITRTLESDWHEGVVKWFDDAKGYGFITGIDRQDVFVHHRGVAGEGFRTLVGGQKVRFKRRLGKGTFEAIEVMDA